MKWIKITERLPEEGVSFIAARFSVNKGYQPELCFRDGDRYFYPYDVGAFMGAQDWGFADEDETYEGVGAPDWWAEIPPCEGLEVYEGSPTAKRIDEDFRKWKEGHDEEV